VRRSCSVVTNWSIAMNDVGLFELARESSVRISCVKDHAGEEQSIEKSLGNQQQFRCSCVSGKV